MKPLLEDGSFAVFHRAKAVKAGDVVLVDHQKFGRIIKSVKGRDSNGISLMGLHPDSMPPEKLGHISEKRIIGRLVWQLNQ